MTDAANYFEYIDKYCERTVQGLWGEPLNVISNVAFLIVFLLLLKYFYHNFHGRYRKNWDIAALIFLIFCLTLGSTAWHVFAVRWALFTDIIPILIFINLFMVSCFFRVLNRKLIGVIALFGFYQLFNYLIQRQFSIETLNGSIFYLPVVIYLFGITLFVSQFRQDLHWYYLASTSIFTVALTLRTFDMSQCDSFPAGTHFLWHTFIAIVLYLLTMSLMMSKSIKVDANIDFDKK